MQSMNGEYMSKCHIDKLSFMSRREVINFYYSHTIMYIRQAFFLNCHSKLMTNTVSAFASAFVFHWNAYFGSTALTYPPAFDALVILNPTDENLRDYLSWRQADCECLFHNDSRV